MLYWAAKSCIIKKRRIGMQKQYIKKILENNDIEGELETLRKGIARWTAPIIQRKILYRLPVGDPGERLRQMAQAGSQSQQIARAIDWLKGNFAEPLRIDDLATKTNMSTSTFHQHFRSLTARMVLIRSGFPLN